MAIPNPCRVAVLATHPIHYQIQLYRRLAQVPGMDVTMLFCSRFGLNRQIDPTFGIEVQWYDESILDGCKYKFLENPLWERGPTSVYATISPSVFKEITSHPYNVVLIQSYAGVTEWIAVAAAIKQSCHVLFRGETVLKSGSLHARDAFRWMPIKILAKWVSIFLPIGTRSREFYLHYGIPQERLILSPYAVDNNYFFSQARLFKNMKRELRESLGIDGELPVVLFVSKMTPRKRPLDLLKAFDKLQEDAFLLFVGDGPLRAEIEGYVASRQLRNVRCAGFQRQETLPQFYAVGDVFVLPSEYEPWGLVVNEAMCFSLPIITTHGVAAAADLVKTENGFLYEAGNVKALEAALRILVSGAERRLEMGRQSSKIVEGWDLDASVYGVCQGISMPLAH